MDMREPFDRRLKRVRRDRAARQWEKHGFLQRYIADELIDRLDAVTRDFERTLVIGYAGKALFERLEAKGMETMLADPGRRFAAEQSGVQCDEDRLPFADGSFDLVLSPGMFDCVNDLPGTLTLVRRILRPDGLLLAGFAGAGSLSLLREAALKADLAGKGAAARIHPQIDVRSAGDLLSRAGFQMPVADGETLSVRYRDTHGLIADLRSAGLTSLLGGPRMGRDQAARLYGAMEDAITDGRITEHFKIVYMTGWSPGPGQPQPARRGSGSVSLADTLERKA